ncbi:MAG: gamma-glutamyltransferase family protein [Alphaproteobacteria bacterium]
MFTTRPELRGTFGMVASTHWLASATGMAMLEQGGNAFDAAVAAGFVLQVVEPHLNGPGGDLPILVHRAGSDAVEVICGQGVAPRAATIDRFKGLGLEIVPGTGLLAACVPGAFDAWIAMLRDYGTMELEAVMAPAIGYARDGYPLVPGIVAAIAAVEDLFRTEWPSSAAVYLPRGQVPGLRTLFRNPVLAATYQRIVDEARATGGSRERRLDAARDLFYRGFVAEAIGRYCATTEAMDTSGRRHRGLLTADDMAGWQARIEPPLAVDYHGWRVFKPGVWSQGPVLLQQLALLDGLPLAQLDPLGPDFVHTVVEGAKLAFADRDAWYADPDHVDVPAATLIGADYAGRRRGLIDPDRASTALRPGDIGRGRPFIPSGDPVEPEALKAAGAAGFGEPTVRHTGHMPGDTCHLDAVDRWGNMVSATPSGGWLHSSPVIPELGFCLGTRMQMFWLDPQAAAALAPGRRPRTTLSASMALDGSGGGIAFGTPGGDNQDQWATTLFLRWLHHGLDAQAAIDAPMFDMVHFPSSFYPRATVLNRLNIEGRFAPETVAELSRRGHQVAVQGDWALGRLSMAGKRGAERFAAANPRFMQGYAVGR